MSIDLKDGPCKGTYLVKRAPVYLRAVKNEKGETDVLDQPDDSPDDSETVYVYEREGSAGTIHIDGEKIHGRYALAFYHHLADVDGQKLRVMEVWRAWAISRFNGQA
jgi:hypothetical protein